MNLIIINFLIQCSALIIGISIGSIIHWLAEEELETYKKMLEKGSIVLFLITFLSPLFFVDKLIFIIFIALSWGVVAFPQRNEKQVFYFLSPVTLFLSTQSNDGFFLTAVFFMITTVVLTIRDGWRENRSHNISFIIISGFVYAGTWIYLIN